MVTAPYDDIADWYEADFLAHQRRTDSDQPFADFIGVDQAIVELLGPGQGRCLEVGCGTGIYAERIRSLGRVPIGVDISTGMLRHAVGRLPILRGDAAALPVCTESLGAALAVMVHSDMADYGSALAEIHRVLKPGATFLHIGVHPCFIGDFADRTNNDAIVVRPGYLQAGWTPAVGPTAGRTGSSGQVRDKVGAAHYPLAALLNLIVGAGFDIGRTAEGWEPTPITFSVLATKR